MRVGFYQFAPVFGEVNNNLDSVIAAVSSMECDLLVLPELAMSGYQFISQEEVASLAEPVPEGPTTRRLVDMAKRRDMFVVAGIAEQFQGQFYNSAVLVGPSRQFIRGIS